jgi:hypothetical protein
MNIFTVFFCPALFLQLNNNRLLTHFFSLAVKKGKAIPVTGRGGP